MVANSSGQCYPDYLKMLWLTVDHATQTQYDINNCLNENIIDSQQAIGYRQVRGEKYHENSLRLLTCFFEAINERFHGTRMFKDSK